MAVGITASVTAAAPAAAETKVSGPNRDNVVKITVPVDCVGCEGKQARDGSDLAQYWKRIVEKAWNDAFARFSYCNKYKFELVVDIDAHGDDFDFTKGRHRILVGLPGSGLAQAGWDGITETTPGGDPSQRSPDGTRYFRNDGDGAMAADASPTVVIHEFGHVIGLGDDRDAAGSALPNRGKTMMVGGAQLPDGTFTRASMNLKIDKELIDRIGHQLANLGKLTCGQAWNGAISGEGVNHGLNACNDPSAHEGTFSMVVEPDGDATLAGTMVNTSVCVGGFTTAASFTMRGEKRGSKIVFAGTPNFPFAVELRVRGDEASDTTTTNPDGQGVYVVTLDLTAECDGCDVG
jgi:hypothetical protein